MRHRFLRLLEHVSADRDEGYIESRRQEAVAPVQSNLTMGSVGAGVGFARQGHAGRDYQRHELFVE